LLCSAKGLPAPLEAAVKIPTESEGVHLARAAGLGAHEADFLGGAVKEGVEEAGLADVAAAEEGDFGCRGFGEGAEFGGGEDVSWGVGGEVAGGVLKLGVVWGSGIPVEI